MNKILTGAALALALVTELSWVALQDFPEPLFQPLDTFLQLHGDMVVQYIEQVKLKHAA